MVFYGRICTQKYTHILYYNIFYVYQCIIQPTVVKGCVTRLAFCYDDNNISRHANPLTLTCRKPVFAYYTAEKFYIFQLPRPVVLLNVIIFYGRQTLLLLLYSIYHPSRCERASQPPFPFTPHYHHNDNTMVITIIIGWFSRCSCTYKY